MAITQLIPASHLGYIQSPTAQAIEIDYWPYFNTEAAYHEFEQHLENSKSQHTHASYRRNLSTFMKWLELEGNPFIDVAVFKDYLSFLRSPNERIEDVDGKVYRTPYCLIMGSHQKAGHRMTSSTINTYAVPVRLFLRLIKPIPMPIVWSENVSEMLVAMQLQQGVTQKHAALLEASKTKGLPPDDKSSDPALERYGTRLSQESLVKVLQPFQTADTLRLKRDKAIMYAFIFSGIRISSVGRIIRGCIKHEFETTYSMRLTHKGNKTESVAIDEIAVNAINDYITAYNEQLVPEDPRYINEGDHIFYRLSPHKNRVFANIKTATTPLGDQGLRDIVEKYAAMAGVSITPHDLRRTFAALSKLYGMDILALSKQLCHASLSQTAVYIGPQRQFQNANIVNLQGFNLKERLQSEE